MALFRKRLLRIGGLALLAALLLLALTPLVVSNGVRLWLWWKAKQQKLTITVDKIESPFLRPLVLAGVHISTLPDAPCRMEITAQKVRVNLNLRSVLMRTRGRAIDALAIDTLRGEFHRQKPGTTFSQSGWNTLQKLLPQSLALAHGNVRIEDGPSLILLREITLTASEIEAGRIEAGEVTISSPFLRQTFSSLRGATNWQGDRLALAGLTLAGGLDLQSFTIDLSRLSKQYIGLEFDLDAFGGKIRANVSSEWRSDHTNWNLIGSATDISLRRTSEAFGVTDHLDGAMHACKFTFRGDFHDPAHITASLWTELTGLSWHDRAADVIMLGASLYNRQVELQQFYVKQRDNELNLNGQASLPEKSLDLINGDFRGNISASITNLDDFASLFGAKPGDFTGEVNVEGTMDAGGRKIGGHLTATGQSLKVFKTPVDSFTAKVSLKASELEVEQLELHRKNDALEMHGKIDLGPERTYSGTSKFSADDIAHYLHLFPFSWNGALLGGALSADWSGTGNTTNHSGAFHLKGRALRISRPTDLLPFNAELDATYAPGNIFFRQAHLTNERTSLNGFVTIASNYIQMQAIALDLDGKPKLRGNIFVPLALAKTLNGENLLKALDNGLKLDVDLALEPTDLADLSKALFAKGTYGGTLASRVSIFGGLDALQGWSELHARDFAQPDDPARTSADLDARFASGTLNLKAGLQFRASSPVTLEGSLPVRLGEQRKNVAAEAVSATLDFPKVAVGNLPRYLSRDLFREGGLSGKIAVAETVGHPKFNGEAQLTNGQPNKLPIKASSLAAKISLSDQMVSIDSLKVATKGIEATLHGNVEWKESDVLITLSGDQPLFNATPLEELSCVSDIAIASAAGAPKSGPALDSLSFLGSRKGGPWTVVLSQTIAKDGAQVVSQLPTSMLCPDGKGDRHTLTLAVEPPKPTPRPRTKRR